MALVVLFLVVGCSAWMVRTGSSPEIVAVEQTQFLPPSTSWKNLRYCEVIPVFRRFLMLYIEVYNTIGLNDCPEQLWSRLEPNGLQKQYGAEVVKLNGPRYWVLDKLVGHGETTGGKVSDFAGLQMKLVAKLENPIWQGSVGDKLYTPNEVQRNTVYTYWRGNKVYELVSPTGEVYRMQSYSLLEDKNLDLAALETLGKRLKLPSGWTYRTRVLTKDSTLTANGLAYVINDDFYNAYQKILPTDTP